MQQTLRKIEQTIRDELGYYPEFNKKNETILNGFDFLIREYQKHKDNFIEMYAPQNLLKNKKSHLLFPKSN